jgi:thymidylate synthase
MRENIMSTRLKVASWNPSEINKTALPPCHDNFQVIGVPLFDNEMIAERTEIFQKQMKREELIKIPGTDLKCIGDKETRFLVSHSTASYATLRYLKKLGVEGNLKCVHFYDNQFEAVETLLKKRY